MILAELAIAAPSIPWFGISKKFNPIFRNKAKIKIFWNTFSFPVICIITPTEPENALIIWPISKIYNAVFPTINSGPKKDNKNSGNAIRKINIGFRSGSDFGQTSSTAVRDVIEESLILTGDQNIADVHFTVLYKIKHPSFSYVEGLRYMEVP